MQNKTEHIFGINENEDFLILLEKCREFIPNCDEKLIQLAFNYCVVAHEGKLRKSGQKFYTHPLAVAFIVIQEIPLDNESVVAALLHNVLDESEIYTYEDIRFTFGATIAHIVEGITRIKFVESQHIDRPDQLDNYRKLLLTLFSDIRIILIKLADKLDSMRTLQFVSSENQRKIAQETLDIYVPFANRFSMRGIKIELEDLAFKYINPQTYKYIEDTIKGTYEERQEYIDKFKEPLIKLLEAEGLLQKENVSYVINGRAKNIYSIYNKTILRQKNVEELYDIFAIRIILNTENPLLCFYVYGVVANYYKPIPETFKDYISSPKESGYSSLHCAVAGPDNKIVEVQIRTEQMHKASEVGVAAHFRYKSGVQNSILDDSKIQNWLDEIRDVFENIGDEDSSKLHNIISNNMLRDKIYVFTPKDEFRQLPKGATALDFAFDIHTEIGLSCIGAKVNGKLCAINHILNSGDKVEIITSQKQTPSKNWLDFVTTSKASSKLIGYFKDENNKIIARGKELWKKKNEEIGFKISDEDMFYLLKVYNFDSENDFYKALGNDSIDINKTYQLAVLKVSDKVLRNVENYDRIKNHGNVRNYNDIEIIDANDLSSVSFQARKLKNRSDYSFEFLDCCEPLPFDSIFGIQESENIISVHCMGCLKYKKLLRTHPNDLIMLDWEEFSDRIFNVKLHIIAEDIDNLVREIVEHIIEIDANNQMTFISFDVVNSVFDGILGFNININSPIKKIISSIEKIDGIQTVERVSAKK